MSMSLRLVGDCNSRFYNKTPCKNLFPKLSKDFILPAHSKRLSAASQLDYKSLNSSIRIYSRSHLRSPPFFPPRIQTKCCGRASHVRVPQTSGGLTDHRRQKKKKANKASPTFFSMFNFRGPTVAKLI